jgi:hypothetical protein
MKLMLYYQMNKKENNMICLVVLEELEVLLEEVLDE